MATIFTINIRDRSRKFHQGDPGLTTLLLFVVGFFFLGGGGGGGGSKSGTYFIESHTSISKETYSNLRFAGAIVFQNLPFSKNSFSVNQFGSRSGLTTVRKDYLQTKKVTTSKK